MTLSEFLTQHGFVAAIGLPCDGEFHRFDRRGTLSGYFKGLQAGDVIRAWCGDMKTQEKYEFTTDLSTFSPEEAEAKRLELAIAEKQAKEKRALRAAEAEAQAKHEWENSIDGDTHPYLKRKHISGLHGAKLSPNGYLLLVPGRDTSGALRGLQRIHPNGDKPFQFGFNPRGTFHVMGDWPGETGRIFVCEGFATAASVREATGECTVVAFNAGNLLSVCRELRARYPRVALRICGDDDLWTTRGEPPEPYNPGREMAQEASQMVGGRVLFPSFESLDTRPTDFNDLHALEGLEAVRAQVSLGDSPAPSPTPVGAGAGDTLYPLPWGGKKGTEAPAPQAVANALRDHYHGKLLRQEEDLFRWTGTHWAHLATQDLALFYRELQFLYSGRATFSQLDGMFKLFKLELPVCPVNIWAPRAAHAANFLDGTLHVVRGPDYIWRTDFRPHRQEDYLVNTIPLEYKRAEAKEGSEFRQMLARVFAGKSDTEARIHAVQEMYGACLLPYKPHLFLLHGPAGGGKSSVIIPAMRLVHQDNWCSVQPHEFKGFLMESMIGKLVNFRTDISTTQAISDDSVKMIEDRVPIRMDRKFKTAIQAPLPAIHVFGANGIPSTLEAGSGAHIRRWTFIECDSHRTELGKYRQDFGNEVFDADPYDVLAFAIEGIDRVLKTGHYSVPESGLANMHEWLLSNDPIGQFLADIREGELGDQNTQVKVASEGRIERGAMFEIFKNWHLKAYNSAPRIGRTKFYIRVKGSGIGVKTIKGVRYFEGFEGAELETSEH